jgi:tRNA-2-methylthio-N6-dimethylallyladenosine synthase
MNRKYTIESYLEKIDAFRRYCPEWALSTDLIVGFPGESDADFRATLELCGAIGFAQAFSFKYSARPGTPAAAAARQIPEPLKAERLAALQALLVAQQRAFNRACIGRVLPVLFEKPGRHAGQLVGRSPYLQSVHAEAEAGLVGEIVPVMISGAGANSLAGGLMAA